MDLLRNEKKLMKAEAKLTLLQADSVEIDNGMKYIQIVRELTDLSLQTSISEENKKIITEKINSIISKL